jgi:methionine-rich copper-binding protein CopC
MKKVLSAVFALGIALVFSTPAFSHAAIVKSTPQKNSILIELPSEFRIEFNEDLLVIGDEDPNVLKVTSPSGIQVSGPSEVAGPFIFAPNSSTKVELGPYRVVYRIVSADGHVVEGEYSFEVKKVDSHNHNTSDSEEAEDADPVVTAEATPYVVGTQDTNSHNSFLHLHAEHIILSLIAMAIIAMWFLIARSKNKE